uniref:LRR binding FLII interacting protein 1 n=1 Tax=Pavo cristatus TaxID=9049 RepID=A0A8C9ENL6_PAVCR
MGTQGAGRKRLPNRERLTAEDDALNQIAREAEARLAAKRAARAEAREIRMKELERQQKEPSDYSCYLGSGSRASSRASSARASPVIEERPEKDFEKGARTVSSLSAATLASLGGTSSRRGSGDTSISADTEASIREIKDSLAEVEEKYKKAMVSNAQLDNEKTNFMYQVDTLKDALLELEEQLAESRRQYEEKSKEFEREKHAHSILQFQFKEIKEALKQREEMLAKHGIIPDSDIATNGEASDALDNEGHLDSSKTVQGTTQALKTAGDGMLGKANEVDMKNEILEDVGKREILQNSEREERKEESEEQEVQTLHADENTKAEKMIEETAALSTVMLPDSRFTEPIQSLTEPMTGNASSNDDSDADDLRQETESAGTAAQQPATEEAERSNLNPRTAEKSELGSLPGQDFESPQETHGGVGVQHELIKAAPQQEEGGDVEASHALSANEVQQAADSASDSSEIVSGQSGLLEPVPAGSLSEEVNVEGHAETLRCLAESAENRVRVILEEALAESKDCTDGTADETGGNRAGEQNKVGSAVQGQKMERDSMGLEGEEPCESGAPSDTNEEGGDQAHIQPVSSEDGELALLEEQNTQEQTELKPAEKDGQKEALIGNLEACSDSVEKQEKASGESAGSATRVEGSALHQAEPGTATVTEMAPQETSLDPGFSDDETEGTEMQTGDVSGKGEENRVEYLEDNRTEDLKPKVELQTAQCSEETTGDTEDEKNVSLESEAQNVVKQEESESKEESIVCHSVTSENQVDKEAFKENKEQSELAAQQGDGFTSVEDAGNSLAQKAELDENVGEQLGLEGQAEEEQEDDGDAFDFDEDSEQTLETDEKCDGEVDAQSEEDDRTDSVIRKTAQTGEAGERTGKIETSGTLTEDDSLQHKKGNESEETGHLQEEASALKTAEKADVLADENQASDSNEVEKAPGENVLEQDLESAGCNRAESKEDLRGGRKGKGRSRDDCTMS